MPSEFGPLFFVDVEKKQTLDTLCTPAVLDSSSKAWSDDDDENVSVSVLKSSTKRLRQDDKEASVSGVEYCKRVKILLSSRPKWLQSAYQAVPDALETISPLSVLRERSPQNGLSEDSLAIGKHAKVACSQSKAKILSIDHHPGHALVMVTVQNEGALIFDSRRPGSPPLYSLKSMGMCMLSARFSRDGSWAIISGKTAKIVIWHFVENRVFTIPQICGRKERAWTDLEVSPCGKRIALKGDQGSILILSSVNYQVLGTLKSNNAVSSLCFSPDGAFLFSVGSDNFVYVWDCTSYTLYRSFVDDSGTCCTSIAVSQDMSLLAVGGNLGVLNFYDLQKILTATSERYLPCKVIDNVTTAITFIEFHPSCELVLYGSNLRSGAVRLIHLPSFRVFSNWPKRTTPLSRILAATIDPSGSRLLFGNERGELLIYGLRHFETEI